MVRMECRYGVQVGHGMKIDAARVGRWHIEESREWYLFRR